MDRLAEMRKAPETWGGKIWLGYKIGEGRYKGAGPAHPRSPQSPPAPSSPANPAFTAILARRQPSPITGLPPALTPAKRKDNKEYARISLRGALARGPGESAGLSARWRNIKRARIHEPLSSPAASAGRHRSPRSHSAMPARRDR